MILKDKFYSHSHHHHQPIPKEAQTIKAFYPSPHNHAKMSFTIQSKAKNEDTTVSGIHFAKPDRKFIIQMKDQRNQRFLLKRRAKITKFYFIYDQTKSFPPGCHTDKGRCYCFKPQKVVLSLKRRLLRVQSRKRHQGAFGPLRKAQRPIRARPFFGLVGCETGHS